MGVASPILERGFYAGLIDYTRRQLLRGVIAYIRPIARGSFLSVSFRTTHFRRPRITSEAQSPSSAAGGAPRGLFGVNLRRIFLRQTFGCAARGNLKRLNIKLGRPVRRG